MKYADIALNTKSSKRDDLFTYSVPKELQDSISIGQLVLVPLGKRIMNGIVIKLHSKKPKFKTRDIDKVIDGVAVVDDSKIELARFISDYYWCSFSQALFHMLPPNLRKRRTRVFKEGGKSQKPKIKSVIQKLKFTIKLNERQKNALEKIKDSIKKKMSKTFLLHGVTNSGKTEVYLRAFDEVLKNKGQGIFIVPEISLTPQIVERFENVFGEERIAVVHSKLSLADRLKTWTEIKGGKKDIVIGSRSAVFAPLSNLKLIVVDEEHDLISFKSDQTPRYELHVVAEEISRITDSTLVFGTATPLVESYFQVVEGNWEYLSMPDRVDISESINMGKKEMPRIKIVDMNDERKKNNYSLFSEYLVDALNIVLKNKKQALLFLNRRGMATTLLCRDCGEICKCDNCEVPLVYHLSNNKLWCHHCGAVYDNVTKCKNCGGFNIQFLGKGTERIEEDIKKFLPKAMIARMDRDTMVKEQDYKNIFSDFEKGKIDIIIGTQMIVHGWDLPSVDLAGVISLDAALNIPDFRSSEKVFQLITQLAGRTGRANSEGILVLQTFEPENWVYSLVKKGDYLSFIKKELDVREKFSYPPFAQVIKLSISDKDKEKVEKKAMDLKKVLESRIKNQESIKIVGPAYPLIAKKYGRWWQNVIVKLKTQNSKLKTMELLRDDLLEVVPKEWTIDIDPLSLL